jgi:hypothetical protein
VLTALRQGVARATPEDYNNPHTAALLTESLMKLHQLHGRQQIDLATECLEEALKHFQQHPPRSVPEDQVEATVAALQKRLEQLHTRDLPPLRESFELNAARAKQPLMRAYIAVQHGLVREAVKELEEQFNQMDDAVRRANRNDMDEREFVRKINELPIDAHLMLVRLYLTLGRVAEAQARLDFLEQLLEKRLLAVDPKLGQIALRQWRVNAAVAGGDFALARRELDLAATEQAQEQGSPRQIADLCVVLGQTMMTDLQPLPAVAAMAKLVGLAPLLVDPQKEPLTQLAWPAASGRLNASIRELTEFNVARGLLALEEGDTPAALQFLGDAVQPKVGAIQAFPGRGNAAMYVNIMKREAGKPSR